MMTTQYDTSSFSTTIIHGIAQSDRRSRWLPYRERIDQIVPELSTGSDHRRSQLDRLPPPSDVDEVGFMDRRLNPRFIKSDVPLFVVGTGWGWTEKTEKLSICVGQLERAE